MPTHATSRNAQKHRENTKNAETDRSLLLIQLLNTTIDPNTREPDRPRHRQALPRRVCRATQTPLAFPPPRSYRGAAELGTESRTELAANVHPPPFSPRATSSWPKPRRIRPREASADDRPRWQSPCVPAAARPRAGPPWQARRARASAPVAWRRRGR